MWHRCIWYISWWFYFLITECFWAGEWCDFKKGSSCWRERWHTPTRLQILRGRAHEISSSWERGNHAVIVFSIMWHWLSFRKSHGCVWWLVTVAVVLWFDWWMFFVSQPSLDTTEALDFLSGGFTTPSAASAAKTPICPASKSPAKVRFMDVHNGSNHHKLNLFNMSIAYLTQQWD